MRAILTTVAALFFAAAQARATAITINNPSFEDDLGTVGGPGGWSNNAPTGWTDPQGNDNTNFIENISGFVSEGQLHLGFDGNELGFVYQDLTTAWTPNTTYTFVVGVGNRGGFGAGTGRFGLGSSLDPVDPAINVGGDGPYLLQTPSVFFSDLNTSTIAPDANTFADATFSYVTGAVAPAGNIRISVQSIDATRIHVDNFRLDAVTIPEPSSLAALGVAAGLLMRRRRA